MGRYTIPDNNLLLYMNLMLWMMYIEDIRTGSQL